MQIETSSKSVIMMDINKCYHHPENPHQVLDSEVKKVQATIRTDAWQCCTTKNDESSNGNY